jgi:hypothetical protein
LPTRGAGISIIGGADIHIFVCTDCKNNRFQKKLIGQNTNIWISAPPIIDIPAPLLPTNAFMVEKYFQSCLHFWPAWYLPLLSCSSTAQVDFLCRSLTTIACASIINNSIQDNACIALFWRGRLSLLERKLNYNLNLSRGCMERA